MDQFDDFDPDGQKQDGSKAIIALLVIMALMLVWGTFMAPKPTPPPKAEDPKATTALDTGKDKKPSTATQPTIGPSPKTATATPAKGEKQPEPPVKPPEKPPEPAAAPELPPVELTKASGLLCASFTNQDARLARLILLDHYRTPAARRAALRAKRRDPEPDLSPYGLPLLGQEEGAALGNGGFEDGDTLAAGQAPPDRPDHWVPSAAEDVGKTLLWSDDAHSGSKSIAIKDPTRDAQWRITVKGIQPRATSEQPGTYEFACWVKLDAAGGAPVPSVRLLQQAGDGKEVAWKDEKGALHPAALDLSVPKAVGWQRLAARFLAEPSTQQAQVLFHAPQGFKGQAWLDDVSLVRFGEPSLVLLPPTRAKNEAQKAEDERLFDSRRFQLAAQTGNSVTFRATIPDANLEITKTFTLPKDDDPLQRHVTLDVEFRNLGEKEFKHPGYLLRGPGGLAADLAPARWKHGESVPDGMERQAGAANLSAAVAREATGGQFNVPVKSCADIRSLETPSEGKPATTWDEVGGVLWAAVTSNYFVSIIEPRPADSRGLNVGSGGARCSGEAKANLAGVLQVAPFALGPKGKGEDTAVHRFRLYAGPKKSGLLASYGANYEQLIPSRWLDPLTAACAWVLRAAYFVIPNYGIAIIILTCLVRLVLHPLSKKSQTSMQKMQKLQPQVAEIREKFKGDKKRQQEEMMKLYKTYGVNPMGGCLPIVLQIPVFIGLWRALQESIELRQAPFAFWIQDLSQPDSLFGAVNVLPIVSCAMMFIQQKLTPKAGDPQQQQTQKMMGYIMPVFLGWILYGLPSGLGLYFIASTLVGLGEQRIIKRHMDRLGELKPVVQKASKQSKMAIFSKGSKKPKKRLF